MDNKLQALDYAIIGIMLLLSSSVGLYFRFTGGRQRTIDEYLMGNKRMRMFPVSVSLMAAFMSANAILGVPSETYLYGTQWSMWLIGGLIGSLIVMYGYLPVYFDLKINSVNEFLGVRFGSTTRTIVAGLQVIRAILFVAVVLYSPSLALNAITGISIWTAAISMACVCTFYCFLGGLKAVIWTDIFQAVLMTTTVVAVIIGGTKSVGFLATLETAKSGGRFKFFDFSPSLTERYTFWNCIMYGIQINLEAFGSNQIELQRILSVEKLRRSQMSILLATFYNTIFTILCVWSGIVIFSMYADCDPILNSKESLSPDKLIPLTIMKLFSNVPGLTGLCVAGIFSASLSTISSVINGLTSLTVEDFLKPFFHCKCFNDSWMAFTAKLLTILYGAFCLLLSYMVASFRGIMEANIVLGGMIGGPITGIFILGFFNKYANQIGALFGLMSGSVFGLWLGFGTYIIKAEIPTLSRSVSGCKQALNDTIAAGALHRNYSSHFERENNVTRTSNSPDITSIFPLYDVAFLWVPVFSSLATIISGTIASFIVSFFFSKDDNHSEIVSPVSKKFNFRSKAKKSCGATSQDNLISGNVVARNFETFGDIHMNNYEK